MNDYVYNINTTTIYVCIQDGSTALAIALTNGSDAVVRTLVDKGAKYDAQSNEVT